MTKIEAALKEDQQNRARALALESFIVEAPAGAGKTELLTQRFLKLLQTVQQPEEIIAITFTNKAAAEMRSRIIDSLLLAAAGELPAEPHKRITFELSQQVIARSEALGWALLENPARLRLYTIDGLCAALSRQMPLMSSFGAQPSIADDAEQHYLTAVQQTLALIDDDAYQAVIVEALRYLDNDSQKLTQLLVAMLGKRDQWLQLAQQHHDVEALVDAFAQVIDDNLAQIAQILDAPFQAAVRPFAQHAAQHVDAGHSVALLRDWEADLLPDRAYLPQWQALAELMLTGKNTLRKTVTKKNGFPTTDKETKQAFTELLTALQGQAAEGALAALRAIPDLQADDDAWQMISTLSQLLNLAAAQLWLVFAQAGEVDFIEVSQRAISALSDHDGAPTDLALRLDYQIQHILVDEFQDTSPSQIQLLDDLTNGWQASDGRTLFLVGDPMQSIYRFRKAEVGLFLNAAAQGVGDVRLTPLRLYRNNRSCPTVIEWVNNHFNSAFPAQDMADAGAISYRPFMPTREAKEGEGVQVHPVFQLPEVNLTEARQQEAQRVVQLVLQTRESKPDANIAILARARSHLMPIVALLRKEHPELAFQAVDVEALNTRQVIQDLLALTRALLHRADRVNWLAVLRAPWCGLTLNDLHALAGKDHHSTIWSLMQRDDLDLSADGKTRLDHVKAILQTALLHQGRQRVSRWVYGVWLQLSGPTVLWKQSDSADVDAFFACMQALENQQQFSLTRLALEIDKLYAAPDPDGQALQMMTIHKSKGLEFDTVIVTGMGNQPNMQDDQPIVRWESVPVNEPSHDGHMRLLAAPYIPKANKNGGVTPYDYLKQLEKQRIQHEDARVLYVAVTRAERVLHLVGVVKENAEGGRSVHQASYFGLLWPQLVSQINDMQTAPMAKHSADIDPSTFTPKLIRLASLALPEVMQTQITSAVSKAPVKQEDDTHDSQQLKADIGTLTHYYLELMCRGEQLWQVADISAWQSAMQYWFGQRGYAAAEAKQGASAVEALLIKTLQSEDGQWLLQTFEEDQAELAMLTADGTTVAGEVKRYVLDRTFIAEHLGQKTRWIVDYKTAALEENLTEAALVAATEPYAAQLAQYAALFGAALPIQKAIYFVSIGRLVLLP